MKTENQEIVTAQTSNVSLIDANYFNSLEAAKEVQIDFDYFSPVKLMKVKESIDIVVTELVENGFEREGRFSDLVIFQTIVSGKIMGFAYAGSSVVRSVKKLTEKFGIEYLRDIKIPLRITYLGKAKGNNGFNFDSFEIVGLTNE